MLRQTSSKKLFQHVLSEFKMLLTQAASLDQIKLYWQQNHLLRAWYRGGLINFGSSEKPVWSKLTLTMLINDCVMALEAGVIGLYKQLRKSHIIKEYTYATDQYLDDQIDQCLAENGLKSLSVLMNQYYLHDFISIYNDQTENGNKVIKQILEEYPQLFSNSRKHSLISAPQSYSILIRLCRLNVPRETFTGWIKDLEINESDFVRHLLNEINMNNVSTLFKFLLMNMPVVAKKLFKESLVEQEYSIKRLAHLLIAFSKSELVNDKEFFNFVFGCLQPRTARKWRELHAEMSAQNDVEDNKVMEHISYLCWLPKKNSYITKFESGLAERDEDTIHSMLDKYPKFLTEYVQDKQPDKKRQCEIFETLLFLDVDDWLLREFREASGLMADEFAHFVTFSEYERKVTCFCNLLISNMFDMVKGMLALPAFQQLLSSLSIKDLVQVYYDLAKSNAINQPAIFNPLLSLLIDNDKDYVLNIFQQLSCLKLPEDNLLLVKLKKLIRSKKREGEDISVFMLPTAKRCLLFPDYAKIERGKPNVVTCALSGI